MRRARRKSDLSRRRDVTSERTVRYQSYSATLLSLFNDAMNSRPTPRHDRGCRNGTPAARMAFAWNTTRFPARGGPLEACAVAAWNHHPVSARWTFSLITRGRLPVRDRSPRIAVRSLKNYCLITVKNFASYAYCALRAPYENDELHHLADLNLSKE